MRLIGISIVFAGALIACALCVSASSPGEGLFMRGHVPVFGLLAFVLGVFWLIELSCTPRR